MWNGHVLLEGLTMPTSLNPGSALAFVIGKDEVMRRVSDCHCSSPSSCYPLFQALQQDRSQLFHPHHGVLAVDFRKAQSTLRLVIKCNPACFSPTSDDLSAQAS